MPAILLLLMEIVPRIPQWIAAGQATYDLYDKVKQVIAEHRTADQPEWTTLEAMIARDQATVRDKSRDLDPSQR